MDEKGFIFTADATLALVVVIVFTVTVVSYTMIPMYMGQDHQHLEALADSALQVMEQDTTLHYASAQSLNGTSDAEESAKQTLNDSLKTLIPEGIGYSLTMDTGSSVITVDNRGSSGSPTYSTDVVTRVRVISGPREGWWARAWYKNESVVFTNREINLTTTSWMFHNWLTNFDPWGYSGNLRSYQYWGIRSYWGNWYPQSIDFAIPEGATILESKYLQGSSSSYSSYSTPSFGTETVINGNPAIVANSNQFTFLNKRVNSYERMYNYQGNISTSLLHTGVNNFYVKFLTSYYNYNMPWFSILTKYTTNLTVPINLDTTTYPFQNTAGLAVDRLTDLGDGNGYGRIYDLETGQVTNLNYLRTISWSSMYNNDHAYSDGIPFVITNVNGGGEKGSAVCVVQDINIDSGTKVKDAYVVVNSWGAVDNALVEVWNSDQQEWKTVFCSFNVRNPETGQWIYYSDRADGYGNLPGIIYIGKDLMSGADNKVRITVFDNVPSSDFDLVGLQDCFTVVSATESTNVKWDTYEFKSHQANDNTEQQDTSFYIGEDAEKAMLFLGVGLNSRNVRVQYADTGQELYNGPVTFALDLAAIDAQKGFHKITTPSSTATDYKLVEGTYVLRVTATGPQYNWESGDWNSNAAIFSGTRIAIISPGVTNQWSTGIGSTAEEAIASALENLYKIDPNATNVSNSSLYVGDQPNAVTVRLDLWKQ